MIKIHGMLKVLVLIMLLAGLLPLTAYAEVGVASVFVPITPCRLVDTRRAVDEPYVYGPLDASTNEVRDYFVYSVEGFRLTQGGAIEDCGVDPSATAVAITLSAVAPTGTGFLRAYPFGGEPTATFLQFTDAGGISNSVSVGICTGECEADLSVKVYGNDLDLVIDISGYYVPLVAEPPL